MLHQFTTGSNLALNDTKNIPCISLLLPFEPTMNLKVGLVDKLKKATDKIAKKLFADYPEDEAVSVLEKLRHVIRELNYNTHKKSIAIFVSSLFEKVYYLDLPLIEKIVVDESFEIRSLINCKKENHKYLLAVLSEEAIRIYIGSTGLLIPIVVNVCDNVTGCGKRSPVTVTNDHAEPQSSNEYFDQFLRHSDRGLNLLLQSYPLPLFIMATEKTITHFKAITNAAAHVIKYIPGSFDANTELELHQIMSPYVANWKAVMEGDLLQQVKDALHHNKLATGIADVSKAAAQKRVRMLVVERNYLYTSQRRDEKMKDAFYVLDVVDEVIENVLAHGGDVEFVDDGLLWDYQQIALIEPYDLV